MRNLLQALLLFTFALPAAAQADLDVWHAKGQTWLVWRDNKLFSGSESWSIYRSSSPIANLASAELVARSFPAEVHAARLQNASPGATWVVPDASGSGTVTLAADEALFVYTPRVATPEYFAVVKTGETLLTGTNTFGPVAQTLDAVSPQPQVSGFDVGHAFTLYALWIDGDDDESAGRPDFGIMGPASLRGVARLLCVFEPTVGLPPEPMPAVGFLHGGGGNYWTYRPSSGPQHELALHVEDGLYVTFDDHIYGRGPSTSPDGVQDLATRWFGCSRNFDRFEPTDLLPPDDEVVIDYTPRWLDWASDWLMAARGVDPERFAWMGLSMGGRGVELYARLRPERVASATAFVMAASTEMDPASYALMGSTTQNLATNVAGGFHVMDLFSPATSLSSEDLPFMRFVDGTNDTVVPWDLRPPIYAAVNANRWGTAIYWDERGHTAAAGWSPAQFVGSPRHAAQQLTGERRDRSFPALHDVDHDLNSPGQQPDPGDPVVPANGQPWGAWGGWFDWDRNSIVDTSSRWGVTLGQVKNAPFAPDNSPSQFAQASLTIARAQYFKPAPGSVLLWNLRRASDGLWLAGGSMVVPADGRVTLPGLPFGPQALRLEVFVRQFRSGLHPL